MDDFNLLRRVALQRQRRVDAVLAETQVGAHRLQLLQQVQQRGRPKPLQASSRNNSLSLAALSLDEQAVKNYIKQNKPTYPQFEAWVKKNAKSLTPQAIEKHNAAVRGYNHDDETRQGVLRACGIPDDASAPKDAVNLNNLDDWYEFHQAVLRG